MEIKRNITINLSESELKEIVAKHLKDEGYNADAENVKFNVSRHLEGFGMGEHEVLNFDGCKVEVTNA